MSNTQQTESVTNEIKKEATNILKICHIQEKTDGSKTEPRQNPTQKRSNVKTNVVQQNEAVLLKEHLSVTLDPISDISSAHVWSSCSKVILLFLKHLGFSPDHLC